MKKKKTNPNKLDPQDLMERYHLSEEQRELVEYRVKKANKKWAIPKRVLESRSQQMQEAYMKIKKLDKEAIPILITAYKEYKLKIEELRSLPYEEGLKNKRERAEKTLHHTAYLYKVPDSEPFWATLTGYQF